MLLMKFRAGLYVIDQQLFSFRHDIVSLLELRLLMTSSNISIINNMQANVMLKVNCTFLSLKR